MDVFSRIANRYIDKGLIAGVEWDIRSNDEILTAGVAGFRDVHSREILKPDQIYRIYSMTKPVVSVAIIRLIEKHKIDLGSIAQEFIPSLRRLKVIRPDGELERLKRPINIADLLTHTAGFSYNFNIGCQVTQFYQRLDILNDPLKTLEKMVDQIATIPLAFQPGEAWRYSVATDILGRILEVVEGKRLKDILKELLFDPLGMSETDFQIKEDQRSRLMPMHGTNNANDLISLKPKSLTVVDIEKTYPSEGDVMERGGSGLFSTVKDYQLFCKFLMDGKDKNGSLIISKMMHSFMLENRIPQEILPLKIGPKTLDGYGWNLLGRLMIDKGQAMSLTNNGEFGWEGAAKTFFWVDIEKQLTGVLMTQFTGTEINLSDEFRAASYSSI
jgi:CubicO group peptidase (beta-lactamase class C family)